MNRPGFEQLMSDVQAGRIERIVVWRMDRLGRNTTQLTCLFNELLAKNVDLVSLKEGFDLRKPHGRLLANLLASISQFENEVRSERIKSALAEAKRSGRKIGGSPKGIRRKRVTSLVPHILTLHKNGVPKTQIARSLKVSVPTVYDVVCKGN